MKILDSREEIHVVLSDQRMPGVTGIDLLIHSQRVRPEVTRLMFTAYADLKSIVDAINQGNVFRYIAKPWDPDVLESIVRQAVEQNELIVERARLVRELTETNQRLLEADRLKGAFIEVASHELNTPVAVVLGMTQLWKLTQAETATPEERHWVDRIQCAGKRLASTVERMLKLMRSDELAHPLELAWVDLEPLLRATVSEAGPFLQARAQTLELVMAPDLGRVCIDRAKVGDVLMNLLVNAIKFTPDGGAIRVSAEARDAESVRIEVADHGVGIEPSIRPYIFEPFFTGFDTLHHSSGEFGFGKRGIGLGLCLAKRFIEMHSGTLEVHSNPGVGSTFTFTLPRQASLSGNRPGQDVAIANGD
jgi:signal transduction histidine kinase